MSKLKIAQEMNMKESQAMTELNIGNCFREMNRYEEAMQHYNSSHGIAKEIKAQRAESLFYHNLAILHSETGNLYEAILMSTRSCDIALSIGDKEILQKVYCLLSSLHRVIGKSNKNHEKRKSYMSKSEEYLKKALDLFDYLIKNLRNHDQFKISVFDNFIQTYKLLTIK